MNYIKFLLFMLAVVLSEVSTVDAMHGRGRKRKQETTEQENKTPVKLAKKEPSVHSASQSVERTEEQPQVTGNNNTSTTTSAIDPLEQAMAARRARQIADPKYQQYLRELEEQERAAQEAAEQLREKQAREEVAQAETEKRKRAEAQAVAEKLEEGLVILDDLVASVKKVEESVIAKEDIRTIIEKLAVIEQGIQYSGIEFADIKTQQEGLVEKITELIAGMHDLVEAINNQCGIMVGNGSKESQEQAATEFQQAVNTIYLLLGLEPIDWEVYMDKYYPEDDELASLLQQGEEVERERDIEQDAELARRLQEEDGYSDISGDEELARRLQNEDRW